MVWERGELAVGHRNGILGAGSDFASFRIGERRHTRELRGVPVKTVVDEVTLEMVEAAGVITRNVSKLGPKLPPPVSYAAR